MPSAWICKKYNLYRVLQFSLIALLSIGIISVFITAHFVVDILQQVLFSFFTSLFITPLLGIVYKLYKESGDIKAILTAFVVGFGACTTLARFEQQFALQKGFGWVTYDISLLLCLLAVCSNKEFLEKKVTP
jgi:membrane protein required for beta-lactamase induction